jgi:RNA recognition motif-containing protein
MINDRDSGRFRGFCFVEMPDAEASKAIAGLDGQTVGSRELRVNEARPREDRGGGNRGGGNNRRSSGGSGGSGGRSRW